MCQQLEHLPLDDFVDDLLDDERRAAIANHLRECSTCATHVEALRETRSLLQQAKQIIVSPRFDQQLDTRVRRDDLKREGIKLLALGLAAMAALLRPLLALTLCYAAYALLSK